MQYLARVLKELGGFARAGFSREVAMRVLRMELGEAEVLLRAARAS